MVDGWYILFGVIVISAILAIMIGLTRLNHFVFRQIRKKKQGLHLMFLERVVTTLIIIVGIFAGISVFVDINSIWQTLLGGTAIISAVVGFAAQDVIKDILAGTMISVYKPFEIGNRIELEDGTTGIVKDITMRHIVLQRLDTQFEVIPNSKLNAMSVQNFSYHVQTRSIAFNFYVGYNSDVDLAMRVIRDAIIASEYSIPGKETKDGLTYGPVYFMAFEASSLRLATTVYYEPTVASEIVMSDINVRVNRALREHGIEIPYNYINVIEKPDTPVQTPVHPGEQTLFPALTSDADTNGG